MQSSKASPLPKLQTAPGLALLPLLALLAVQKSQATPHPETLALHSSSVLAFEEAREAVEACALESTL